MGSLRSGGRILIDQLVAHGAELAFCVPGESYLEALLELDRGRGIRPIVCRMEAGAANMASAYGQVTGRPGVCLVTRGPGAAHAAVGVHTARQGSAPMILLIGQVARHHRGREAFQEVDTDAMFAPLAKWTATVEDVTRLPEAISRAFHTAVSGRPGPVVLGLPEDVVSAEADVTDVEPGDAPLAAGPPPQALARARELLGRARRPLVVVGGAPWSQEAADDARALGEAWSLPVATAFRRQDYIDNDSPAYCGTLRLGMDPRLAQRAREADLWLVLGARLDEPTTGAYELLSPPRPRQTLIHVHPDPGELGRVFSPALAVSCDGGAFAAALARLPPEEELSWAQWSRQAAAERAEFRRPSPDDPLAAAIATLSKTLPQTAIIANGAGNYTLWCHRYWRFARFGTQVAPVSGAMGYGVPAAIAAKLARPDRPVVSFNGDGCFLMCGQELATAVRHRVPVAFVVIDNGSYGTIRMHQRRRDPDAIPGSTELVNPDFVAYARAFGVQARSVAAGPDLVGAVQEALAQPDPALIHVPVSPEVLTPG